MNKNKAELRYYTFIPTSEKREDGTAQIGGRPIVYDSPADIGGLFREIIMPGALDGADMKDVPLFVNHDDNMIPLARSRRNNGNSTMQLGVDDRGLTFTAEIDTARNATAAELYSAIERGDIDGMSFAFRIDGERWEGLETDYPTRYIEKLSKIYEISAVTFPAYDSTDIYARSKEALDSARSAVDTARQQQAEGVETPNEVEILKAKISIL